MASELASWQDDDDNGWTQDEDTPRQETAPAADEFACYFIAPNASQLAAQHLRRLVSVDGGHTSSSHGLILLIAVGFDAEGSIYPLAWASVTTEATKTWSWFFQQLKHAYPWLTSAPLALLSDRQKSLTRAVTARLGSVRHYFCTQHLAANVDNKYGLAARKTFTDLAYQYNKQAF